MDGIPELMDMSLSKLQEMVKDREAWCAAGRGVTLRHDSVTEQQQRKEKWAGAGLRCQQR